VSKSTNAPPKPDVVEKVVKKNQEKKKDVKTKVKQEQDDIIDSLLRNLEDASEGKKVKTSKRKLENTKDVGKLSKGEKYNEELPLSITEYLLIKNQVERNWRPPIGAKDLDKSRVVVTISVNKDGVIKDVSLVSRHCPAGATQTCELLAESAIRAVKATGQLKDLLQDRYNSWKEIKMTFDPSEFGG
jgi:outer membrane biosynthesis protein TonB